MGLLDGKTGIIFGVANKRSIAWAIAQALSHEGMRLAFTYQGERLKENVGELTSTLSDALLLPCDVTIDAEIDTVFQEVDAKFGRLDTLVHSVAFAPRARRFAATWSWRRSAAPPSSSARRCRPPSPARSCTSTVATTSSGFRVLSAGF